MKKRNLFIALLASTLLLAGCGEKPVDPTPKDPTPIEKDPVLVNLDFYSMNDTHGAIMDDSNICGLGKVASYLDEEKAKNQNTIYLSSGDMWQGTAESGLTKGALVNDWMGMMGFESMCLGNHEYDWGLGLIEKNCKAAKFPYLGINVFSNETNKRLDFLDASKVIERSGVKIGIIGASGNNYSDININMVKDINFKIANELYDLVKTESTRLRNEEKCDLIVFSFHDTYKSSYNFELTKGCVDLVLEGHTDEQYDYVDENGIHHVQGLSNGVSFSHVDCDYDTVNKKFTVNSVEFIGKTKLSSYQDDKETLEVIETYSESLSDCRNPIGQNIKIRDNVELGKIGGSLISDFCYNLWKDKYNIVSGGGYLKARATQTLAIGGVTYADFFNLYPFDNILCVCKVPGLKVKSNFNGEAGGNYYSKITEYGKTMFDTIDNLGEYYIVTDEYSASKLKDATVVEKYDQYYFVRDLLADLCRNGGFEKEVIC